MRRKGVALGTKDRYEKWEFVSGNGQLADWNQRGGIDFQADLGRDGGMLGPVIAASLGGL